VPIAPEDNQSTGPVLVGVTGQPFQNGKHIYTFAPAPRFQDGGHQLSGYPFVNVQGHKAMAAIVCIGQGQLLLPISQGACQFHSTKGARRHLMFHQVKNSPQQAFY